MSRLYIARRPTRQALVLPLGGTKEQPNIIIPLYKTDQSELDELAQAVLEKRGRSQDLSKINEQAELDYEYRRKVAEAQAELRMRIREQARFPKLRHGGIKPHRKKSQH